MIGKGRPYSPFTLNVEQLIPWRTLTGRQHFYLDHENYIEWGEHLPVYKPRPDHTMLMETEESLAEGQDGRLFNYITPHGKWSIHSTYGDNERMMTLSRGGYPFWLNAKDAADLGIADNDWVEVYNDNGVFVQRCTTSSRIPRGTVFVYHATERTVGIPTHPPRGQTGRHEQLAHPDPAQAGADERRLRPVHVRLQLLGPDRGQPGHVRLRAPNRAARLSGKA